MAITENKYTGNGSTVLYSFTFPYLEVADIKVSLDGTLTTEYTLANATTVQFNTAPANGVAVRIYRQTDDEALVAQFFPGSAIRAQDLNENFTQNLYVAQEVNNNALTTDGSNPMVGDLNMGGNEILNISPATVANSLVTKGYVDGYINTYYLGGASTNPATRPGGSPLQNGDYYINLPSYQFRYYNGSQWIDVDYDTQQDRIAAETARTGAETAQTGAETAKAGAETARTGAETAKTGAETAKTGAETAKAGAELAQAGSELARSQAQAARDDALLNANIYSSTAAGLAATTVGNYFTTYSGSINNFLDLYRVDAGPVATLVSTYPSQAFFSFLKVDAGYDEQYHAAWIDSQNRLAFGIKPSGQVRIEKGEIGTLSVSSISAPGGSIDLDSVDTPLVNIADGGSIDGDNDYNEFYPYALIDADGRIGLAIASDGSAKCPGGVDIAGSQTKEDSLYGQDYAYAVVDQDNRIAFGVTKTGSFYTPTTLQAASTGIAHGASGLYTVVTDAYGRAQIQSGSNAGVLTLTSSGNNWDPSITIENPERVLFQSDRTAGVRYWVMNANGTRQAPATPDKNDVTFWGDSMTQRLQNYAHLPGLLPGRALSYNALGGTTVEHIIARQGGENATCTIPSGSIPVSGSVALQNVWPTLGYHAGTLTVGATYSYLVTIAGVQGTLTSTTNASSQADYTFTRTSAGSAVNVTGPVEIVVLSNITQDAFGFSKSNTAVFWGGTNPLSNLPSSSYDPNSGTGIYYKSPSTTYNPTNSSAVQARTEAITQAMIDRIENLDRHLLIVGPFIGQGQVWASSTEKLAIVSGFSSFTKHWYDLRTDFIATCKTWLQTNHPAVYANWSASDDTHVANGASPPILREDGIHLNTYGTQLVSQLISSKLTSKGW